MRRPSDVEQQQSKFHAFCMPIREAKTKKLISMGVMLKIPQRVGKETIMKRFNTLCAVLLGATMSIFAQSANNDDEVVKIDPQNMHAYRQGEVIVKFKEEGAVQMSAPSRTSFTGTQVNAVDQLFQTLGVDSVEELMPITGNRPLPRRVKGYNGKDIEPKNLSKLYRLKISDSTLQQRSIHQVIDELSTLDEVEYAEPNYIVYALSSNDGNGNNGNGNSGGGNSSYHSEPLFVQQWGLQTINVPYLWSRPKVTTKRPVIAILDTGVDIEHPDLAANIWTNTAEANGVAKQDDDNNGFKDDIHGWDFINQTGTIRDFNGHGTHCAGIAAAVGDNGIGIAGANPDALIMPVTVMQSDGRGDVATIIKGIDYAAANGADVISMSFGNYGYSMAEEQALGRAYATAILVAAAGNDHVSIDLPYPCTVHGASPMFPAALTFVLGVESSSQTGLASFSNYDPTGPVYSTYGEEKLYNYELRAPGVNIMSTFPGGRYKSLNGTSMACPMVAGAISRLLQVKTDSALVSKEVLFGDLIHSRPGLTGNINMQTVYNYTDANRKPTLSLVGIHMKDSLGDNDGRYDAGETVALYPVFRNEWGMAQNIRYWMKLGFDNQGMWVDDDASLITFLTDTVNFQKPLSSYAKATAENPLVATISNNCADGRRINVTVFAVCDNMTDTLKQKITIAVENGVEIGGMITEDMTLYPNVHYIVTQPLAVPAGVTLTIKPGTILEFKDNTGISVALEIMYNYDYDIDNDGWSDCYLTTAIDTLHSGRVIAKGTPDSMIVFTKANGEIGKFSLELGNRTGELRVIGNRLDPTQYDLLTIESNIVNQNLVEYAKICGHAYGGVASDYTGYRNCIMENNSVDVYLSQYLYNCLITNNRFYTSGYPRLIENCIVANNKSLHISGRGFDAEYWERKRNSVFLPEYNEDLEGYITLYSRSSSVKVFNMATNYYGSSSESIIRQYVKDINSGDGFAHFDLSHRLNRPSQDVHGVVWKVVIDGYDAQDEFDQMSPLGVGTHTCQVYFNRAMDTQKVPTVSYGVRPPYTQHAINENGTWSADSTIYTAEFTITGKTVSDGLNRIYVADAEDNEHFEIPIENIRFNMEISAAGSMSTGLMAIPGLGKITLNWYTDEEDFEDLLGYNIYRWTEKNDSLYTDYDSDGNWVGGHYEYFIRRDTTIINTSLLESDVQQFVDFDVVPGKTYNYFIKQVTTSLQSFELSNVVAATPLTAMKGDANGSMTVDVADVITEVNYIGHQNPQPFIFEAADVNSDSTINVLDIVGTINLIMHPEAQTMSVNNGTATYYIENGILYINSDVVLGGVQLTLAADSATATITPLDVLAPFEKVNQWNNSEEYFFMAYSMSGKTIGIGETALMQIGDADLTSIVLSDTQGHNVVAAPRISTHLDGTKFLPNTEKYINNGSFYVRIGEHIYNAAGILVK